MFSRKFPVVGLFAASLLAFAGCKKHESTTGPMTPGSRAVKVEEVKVGSAVGPDKKIVEAKDEFHPNDTIYVSVETEGTAPEATMTARWLYGKDQVVTETTQRIIPRDAVATEFHVQKADGWPTGEYKVEILLNGEKVASQDFEVKAGG